MGPQLGIISVKLRPKFCQSVIFSPAAVPFILNGRDCRLLDCSNRWAYRCLVSLVTGGAFRRGDAYLLIPLMIN